MSLSKEDEKYYKDVKVLEKYLTPIFIDYDPCCAKDIPFDEMARVLYYASKIYKMEEVTIYKGEQVIAFIGLLEKMGITKASDRFPLQIIKIKHKKGDWSKEEIIDCPSQIFSCNLESIYSQMSNHDFALSLLGIHTNLLFEPFFIEETDPQTFLDQANN